MDHMTYGALDNVEINQIAQKIDIKNWNGVFLHGQLPRSLQTRPFSAIMNLDSGSRNGTHWVAILIPKKGRAEYWDSYGMAPSAEVVKQLTTWTGQTPLWNSSQVQAWGSTDCGRWALMFLLARSQGRSATDFTLPFVGKSTQQNDKYIKKVFAKYLLPKVSKTKKGRHRGDGLLNTAVTIASGPIGTAVSNIVPNSDSNARPLFVGEKHTLLRLPNSKLGRANYMGPGTKIVNRILRGDPPRTLSDRVAKAHDIRYALANDVAALRIADQKMMIKLSEIERLAADSKWNIRQGQLIGAKMFAEDAGLITPTQFATYGGVSVSDRPLLENKLRQLEIQGYGIKRRNVSKKKNSISYPVM